MVVVKGDGYHEPIVAEHITQMVAINEPLVGCNDQEGNIEACSQTEKGREVKPSTICE
jgi:hypothetical protein